MSVLLMVLLLILFQNACSTVDSRVAKKEPVLRVATFNAYLNRPEAGALLKDLEVSQNEQATKVAAIIQRVNPDIILLNEFDSVPGDGAIDLFKKNYLEKSQFGGSPVVFPYVYTGASNTGLPSSFDLNHDGKATGQGADAWGYGLFPGQYAMVLLSKYPINGEQARTFRKFLWKDMPGAELPVDPLTQLPWYSDQVLSQFPLSSKSHWDVPVIVEGKTIHLLASHPTPPTFDGDEDRNGLRNHDEIRFWSDYIDPAKAAYIYDDQGVKGGLQENQRFVILGDLNASEGEGQSTGNPMGLLLHHRRIEASLKPESAGGRASAPDNPLAAFHTAEWGLRVDYVLPSVFGFAPLGGAVYWPAESSNDYQLVGPGIQSSDHRLVYIDVRIDGSD